MDQIDSPFPIALRRRPRRRLWLPGLLTALLFVGALPMLGIAQASRQGPVNSRTVSSAVEPSNRPRVIDRPATITLGALIEVQRRAREQRRAMAVAEQQLTTLSPGEGWQAQLGAFSSADAAERQRARLIEAGVPAVIERVGSLHRLQSIPAMRAETDGLCARAQTSGIDCFVRRAT